MKIHWFKVECPLIYPISRADYVAQSNVCFLEQNRQPVNVVGAPQTLNAHHARVKEQKTYLSLPSRCTPCILTKDTQFLTFICPPVVCLLLLRRSSSGMHENVKKTGGSSGGACGPCWSWLVASTRVMMGPRTPRLYPERPRVGAAPSSVALTSGLLLYCKRTRRRGFVRVCRPEQRLKCKPPMFNRVSQKNQKSEFCYATNPSGFHRLDEPPKKNSALQTHKRHCASHFQFYIVITMGKSAKNLIWS